MKLTRTDYLATGIFGLLTDRDNRLIFCTAEHAYPVTSDAVTASISYAPKVPAGTYTCKRRLSPEFGYDLFWITDVPGATWIEIHIGNYPQVDSEGCVLLGLARVGNTEIVKSRRAFDQFMDSLTGIDSFELEIA